MSNLQELQALQRLADQSHKAKFAWATTSEEETDCDNNLTQKISTVKNSKLSRLRPSFIDIRYDLRGRMVVQPPYVLCCNTIKSALMETKVFQGSTHMKDHVDHLTQMIINFGLINNIISTPPESNERQPQDELRHHEYQNNNQGYTIVELLEVNTY